ncbi:G-protein alpha subunit-domain-containing protein [Flagelloscypha sp. PMI_526]|nr:G-protein alpha subunit-domain-containing protein [Flagelloscypha sp. PMI_526]
MPSRQNSRHDSAYSASDTSTIEYDSQQGIGRLLFIFVRRAGTTVKWFLPSDARLSDSLSIESFNSISQWDDASETSTISRDEEQGIGRVARHFMQFTGAKIEFFAGCNKPVPPRVRVEMKPPAQIEHKLREDRKLMHNEYKILILGGSGVGKSTVVKQMKIQYGGSYSPTERESFKSTIRSHSIHSLKSVITILRRAGHQLYLDNNKHTNIIMRLDASEDIQLVTSFDTSSEVSVAVSSICQDTAIKLAISRLRKFEFGDSVLYFFHAADRVFAASYLPTN